MMATACIPAASKSGFIWREATGLDREQVTSERGILPGVRYAVNAYLDLVSKRSFLEAVASSLTELFSRDLIALRIDRLRAALSVAERRPGLFRRAAYASARRCAVRSGLGDRARTHASRTGTRARSAARQVRYFVGPARRALFRLRRAGLAASRSVPARSRRRAGMSAPESNCVLRLAPGCRLNAAGGPEDLLLDSRRRAAVERTGAHHRRALQRGAHRCREIVEELQRRYASEDAARIETEAVALLPRLRDRGVLEIRMKYHAPALIAEVTHRCPLHCVYCSNPLEMQRRSEELSTADWISIFQQAGEMGVLQLHLTGGEPLARADLTELVASRPRRASLCQSHYLRSRLGRARVWTR